MSTLYLLALAGFGVIMLALMFETVVSVSRKPKWHSMRPALAVVPLIERRSSNLPFVGVDRRNAMASSLIAAQEGAIEEAA